MTHIIALDPGAAGAVCHWHKDSGTSYELLSNLDTFHAFASWIDARVTALALAHAYIEKAQCMPKNGAVGMFKYGQGFGRLLGWVEAMGLAHTLVAPKTWTKVMHAGTSMAPAKKRSLEAARRLFPGETFLATAKSKVPHDGIVDAILICEYAKRDLRL